MDEPLDIEGVIEPPVRPEPKPKPISADNELAHAFLATFYSLDDRAAAWLKRNGVFRLAMLEWPGPIGVAPIEIHPPGIFDFAEEGLRMLPRGVRKPRFFVQNHTFLRENDPLFTDSSAF